MQPRLLQQMQLLMGGWRNPGPGEPTDDTDAVDYRSPQSLERHMLNNDTAESVLKLYTAASGVYEPLLNRLHESQSRLIAALHGQLQSAHGTVAVYKTKASRPSASGPSTAASGPDDAQIEAVGERCDYAFGRVEHAELRMSNIVQEAQTRRATDEETIARLEKEVHSLEEQLKDQLAKLRRVMKDPDADLPLSREEFNRERRIITLERELAQERNNVEVRDAQIADMSTKIGLLKELNGKYARQAVELAARVRVYAEHNDKFATLLSMQHDEKVATDKENEMLRKELVDLNQFHQLRDNLEGEGGTVLQSIDMRGIRHGLGSNASVPRHLHFTGLMNRVAMAKESAITIAADLMVQRQAPVNQRYDLPSFVHAYMTKRHDRDAAVWCYSLDEATRIFDSDVNLNLFGLVSRRVLPEQLYKDIHTDQQMFIKGCEIMDTLQHGTQQLTVPVPHLVGLLLAMYPGYPDGAFRRFIDHLNATLTSNGQAHYFMLFPNMEREEMHGAEASFAAVDIRRENHFSQAFKELILDDMYVTIQQVEDEVQKLTLNGDRVGLSDLRNIVKQLFLLEAVAKEVMAMLKKFFLDHLGSSGNYDVTMPKSTFITLLRTKIPLRKGVYRMEGHYSQASPKFKQLMQLSCGKGDMAGVIMQNLVTIDYKDVLQSLTTHRTSYLDETEGASADEPSSPTSPLQGVESQGSAS